MRPARSAEVRSWDRDEHGHWTAQVGWTRAAGQSTSLDRFPEERLRAVADDDALFTHELGRPLSYRTCKKLWRVAGTETGLAATSYDLRLFTSALISGGASVKQV